MSMYHAFSQHSKLLGLSVFLLSNIAIASDIPHELVGLWQFPDTAVWIDVRENGQVFQCRIDTDGKQTYRSVGKVVNHHINWKSQWGTDQFKLEEDNKKLSLDGKFGVYQYVHATRPMLKVCRNPFGASPLIKP